MQTEKEAALVSVFSLGEAMFGIDALEVQEVVRLTSLTPVHQADETIGGIINLRGQIVTVIDLARRIGMPGGERRHILIVGWGGEYIGLLVDSVTDVVAAEMDDLEPSPANISAEQQKFFKGVCHAASRLVAVLNLDAVLAEEIDET